MYSSAVFSPEKEKSSPGTRATGKSKALGVTVCGEPIDRRPARIAETQEPGSLVERLAGRVVERRAEPLRPPPLPHRKKKRVPAAREETGEGWLERVGLEVERREMPLEVIHGDER